MSPLADPNWKRSRDARIHEYVARGAPIQRIVREMRLTLETVNKVIAAKHRKDERIKNKARGIFLIEKGRKK